MKRTLLLLAALALVGCAPYDWRTDAGPKVEGPNGYTLHWTTSTQIGAPASWSRLGADHANYYVVSDAEGKFVLRTLSFLEAEPFTCAEWTRMFPAEARRLGW